MPPANRYFRGSWPQLSRVKGVASLWTTSIRRAHARPGLFAPLHLHGPPLDEGTPARRVRARRSHPRVSGGRFMQKPASELRRINLPRTPVNRASVREASLGGIMSMVPTHRKNVGRLVE
jgi:hypothetical protein